MTRDTAGVANFDPPKPTNFKMECRIRTNTLYDRGYPYDQQGNTMNKLFRNVVIGLIGAGVSLSMATAEVWRFNNFLPETRPETAQLEQFVTEVNEALGGETELKLYSGGSLGLPNTDTLRFLPSGAVEMSLMWANYLGRDAPALSSVVVQGTIGSIEEFEKAIPTVREIYEEEFAEWDVASVGYAAIPMLSVSVFCRDEPVRTIEDLKSKSCVFGRVIKSKPLRVLAFLHRSFRKTKCMLR